MIIIGCKGKYRLCHGCRGLYVLSHCRKITRMLICIFTVEMFPPPVFSRVFLFSLLLSIPLIHFLNKLLQKHIACCFISEAQVFTAGSMETFSLVLNLKRRSFSRFLLLLLALCCVDCIGTGSIDLSPCNCSVIEIPLSVYCPILQH